MSARPTQLVVVPSREAAVASFFEAGMRLLHRPHIPGDTYQTEDAVLAWARRTADDHIRRGIVVIDAARPAMEYHHA